MTGRHATHMKLRNPMPEYTQVALGHLVRRVTSPAEWKQRHGRLLLDVQREIRRYRDGIAMADTTGAYYAAVALGTLAARLQSAAFETRPLDPATEE